MYTFPSTKSYPVGINSYSRPRRSFPQSRRTGIQPSYNRLSPRISAQSTSETQMMPPKAAKHEKYTCTADLLRFRNYMHTPGSGFGLYAGSRFHFLGQSPPYRLSPSASMGRAVCRMVSMGIGWLLFVDA